MSDKNKSERKDMGYDIKIRKKWFMNPATKVHSSPKGKRGYDRREAKKDFKEQWNEFEEDSRGEE